MSSLASADLAVGLSARLGAQVVSWIGRPRLSILIFHRVHRTSDALFPEEVDAARFDRLMGLVVRAFRVLPLGDAVDRLVNGRLPARSLTITFDDGYADNAEVALPILRRHGMPATFFVATGFLDGGRMWNDSVIECLRATRKEAIDLGEFGLGRVALSDVVARRSAIDSLLPRLKYLSLAEREDAVTRLRDICAVSRLPEDLMMRSQQVAQLARAGMEIGGHTVHHPILARLSSEDARAEIASGRAQLEQIIDAPVGLFAYPNGKPGQDYEACHADIVRQLGFRAAVSTAAGAATTGDDPMELPRFTPWDPSLSKWALRLLLNTRRTDFDRTLRSAGRL